MFIVLKNNICSFKLISLVLTLSLKMYVSHFKVLLKIKKFTDCSIITYKYLCKI